MAISFGLHTNKVEEILNQGYARLSSLAGQEKVVENFTDIVSDEKQTEDLLSSLVGSLIGQLEKERDVLAEMEKQFLADTGKDSKDAFRESYIEVMQKTSAASSTLERILDAYQLSGTQVSKSPKIAAIEDWFAKEIIDKLDDAYITGDKTHSSAQKTEIIYQMALKYVERQVGEIDKEKNWIIDLGDGTVYGRSTKVLKSEGKKGAVINNTRQLAPSVVFKNLSADSLEREMAIFIAGSYIASNDEIFQQVTKGVLSDFTRENIEKWYDEEDISLVPPTLNIVAQGKQVFSYTPTEIADAFYKAWEKKNREEIKKNRKWVNKDGTLTAEGERRRDEIWNVMVDLILHDFSLKETDRTRIEYILKNAGLKEDCYAFVAGNSYRAGDTGKGGTYVKSYSSTQLSGIFGEVYNTIGLSLIFGDGSVKWTGRELGKNYSGDDKQLSYDLVVQKAKEKGMETRNGENLKQIYDMFGVQIKSTIENVVAGRIHEVDFVDKRSDTEIADVLFNRNKEDEEILFSAYASSAFNVGYQKAAGGQVVRKGEWALTDEINAFKKAYEKTMTMFGPQLVYMANSGGRVVEQESKDLEQATKQLAILSAQRPQINGNILYIVGNVPFFATDMINDLIAQLNDLSGEIKKLRVTTQVMIDSIKNEKGEITMNLAGVGTIVDFINNYGFSALNAGDKISGSVAVSSSFAFKRPPEKQ